MHIGIDVGGTNLKAGLVDEAGKILKAECIPLNFQGPEAFANTLAELARSVGGNMETVDYVGVGLPGAVSGGDVLFTTNIPMKQVPLERLFRHVVDVPLFLGNDADCAAVGEYVGGAGRGTRDFVVVTLGTGVGVGVILDGRLRGGPVSCEAGHMRICQDGGVCNCGRSGCWEYYASATGLVRMAREAMAHHPQSRLCALSSVDGETIFQAARSGDETAGAVCRRYVAYLCDGVTNLVNILRPEAVAIGGGISAAPEELLLEPLRARVAKECFARHGGRVSRIVSAELGNDAGIIGAAMLGQVI